tara:strand:- start:646 stop:885 length:240 start_codon:yes stop_codon:yes gene_type:complete
MKDRGVDVILCPPFVGAAPEMNKMDYGTYTMLWNLLDLPALVFPTGEVVDGRVDVVEEGYVPVNEIDKAQFERCEFLFF